VKSIAGFLFCIQLFGTLSPVLKIAEFYANRDQIASEYCVNLVEIPVCQGSCYLQNKLEIYFPVQQQQKPETGSNIHIPVKLFTYILPQDLMSEWAIEKSFLAGFSPVSNYSFLSSLDFFHPPQ
jgi:hypothetical protein